ncbi:MAG: DUF2189 domain-containing protein [Pseudomonadota bacterium]|nr:DUF2189 domain-containing protein [Pseudomonadota bacterium]
MSSLQPKRFSIRDIAAALAEGWLTFRAMPGPSIAFAAVFALIGLILLVAVGLLGISPLVLPLAGGFMLVGPALLAGFFELFRVYSSGARPQALHALGGFRGAPAGLWLVAAVCAFLFLIWIADVGVLYSFIVGGEHLPYELPWLIRLQETVVAFEVWASLMGSVLAFIIFAISAFSVPLLYERRADPVGGVHASVRAVFGNLVAAILWGVLLSVTTILAILLLPLLLVVLPVLAYASFVLYRRVFPLET